jgi:hypothetical protein
VKEHPILMQGPFVRAILDGHKTQSRRPIKKEATPDVGFEWAECLCREIDPSDTPCATCASRFPGLAAAGDRIWVRETWDWRDWQSMANRKVRIAYAADGAQVDTIAPCDWNPVVYNAARWIPSIHMPRWACRLRLPLVKVRIERVQSISEADAWAEGYGEHWQKRVKEAGADGPLGRPDPRGWFAMLWDKLYGTWRQNPWVAVYEWGQIEVSR